MCHEENSVGLRNRMVTERLGDFLGDCSRVNEHCPHSHRDLSVVCDCKGPVEWPVMTVRIHYLSPFLSMCIFYVNFIFIQLLSLKCDSHSIFNQCDFIPKTQLQILHFSSG